MKLLLAEDEVDLSAAIKQILEIGGYAVIECVNDADGVKAGDMNRCFKRFYRSDEARASKVHDNGVGLSIAKSIVELHDGKVSAYGSADGVFTIRMTFKSTR